MLRIVVFSIPLFGHVNYGLKLAKKLVEKGNDVFYYSGSSFKNYIEKNNVTFKNYSKEIEKLFSCDESSYSQEYMKTVKPEDIDYVSEIFIYAHHLYQIQTLFVQNQIQEIQEYNPNVIIYDSAAIWGKKVANLLGIPCVCSCTPYSLHPNLIAEDPKLVAKLVFHKQMSRSLTLRTIKSLNKLLNIKFPEIDNCDICENWCGKGDVNLIYCVRDIQLGEKYMLDDKYKFCGILIDDKEELCDVSHLIDEDNINIYISFGTIYNNLDLLKCVVDKLKTLDYNFILNIGKAIDKDIFKDLSNNWKVVNYVPQISLLKNIDIFISHGGVNGVREAAHFGVPILVIPWEGDTLCTAEDIKNGNYGKIVYPTEMDKLCSVLRELLSDEIVKINCKRLSEKMREAGGIDYATKIIENI